MTQAILVPMEVVEAQKIRTARRSLSLVQSRISCLVDPNAFLRQLRLRSIGTRLQQFLSKTVLTLTLKRTKLIKKIGLVHLAPQISHMETHPNQLHILPSQVGAFSKEKL